MAVYVFLNDDYSDWELGYILPSLISEAVDSRIKKRNYEVISFSLQLPSIRSQGSLKITPDSTIKNIDVENIEALILPGGTFWSTLSAPILDELVLKVVGRKKILAAICAATGYLAKLKLLDSIAHTSNSLEFLKNQTTEYLGEANYKNELAVSHNGIITASGLGAVDFTDKILRELEVFEPRISDAWLKAYKYGLDPFRKDTEN